MINIVLLAPCIPGNTGNIGRSCVATGSRLHLIKPLGFDLSEKQVKRSGLDYWDRLDLHVYENLEDFFQKNPQADFWLCSTKAPRCYSDISYQEDCFLFFGSEISGLPEDFLDQHPDRCVRIPMLEEERSLNLSNAASIVAYEALRQQDFPFLARQGKMAPKLPPNTRKFCCQMTMDLGKHLKLSAQVTVQPERN